MKKQKILVFLMSLFFYVNNYAQDDVLTYSNFEHIKDTLSYYNEIGGLFDVISSKKKTISIEDVDKLIELAEKIEYPTGKGFAYRIKGELHKRNLEYITSINNFKKAILFFEKGNSKVNVAKIYNDMFQVEAVKGNYQKGVTYLLESKKQFELLNDSHALAALNNNLGNVYWYLKDYEAAEKSYVASLALQNKSKATMVRGAALGNLGRIYLIQKKYKDAKDIIQESIGYNKKYNEIRSLGSSYATMSDLYIATEEYQKAKIYNDSVLYVLRKDENDVISLEAKQRLGQIELKLGNYKQAKKMLAITREAYTKIDSEINLLQNYKISSKLDSLQGNLKQALAWEKKYQKLSDKRISEISTKKIENAETRYQKELEQLRIIDEQELREQKNNEELFRYRVMTLIILGVLSICLLFALWIIRTRKERKKLIVKLNDSNQVKNKLFSIISHDLKNEIHGLESSLNLMKENEISTDEFDQIVPLLSDRTNQTSILLNNLLNWSKSQMKELRAKPVDFDVCEVISDKFIFFKPKANQKNIKLVNNLDSTYVHADKDMVAIVSQNLIANAIKFCKSNDTITLASVDKEGCYEIRFADTGVGIAPDNINKLFAEETFTTHGTDNESGTGLGLRICKELIELNNGTIKVESTLGQGSTFIISLPKKAM